MSKKMNNHDISDDEIEINKAPKLEDIYKQKDPRQHVLDCPGMYVGSVDPDEQEMRILDDDNKKIIKKKITIVPGFFKITDEVFVNSIDQTVREKSCNTIKVNFDQEKGKISVWNNGKNIPVKIHPTYNIYVPELIFGHLRTSTNYDKAGKTVGGKNGYGAKLANIFSTKFIVELVDDSTNKKYKQVFENNMSKINEPEIESVPKGTEPYIKITFYPDFKKLSMDNGLTDDIIALLQKRVYDIAACSERNDVKPKNKKKVKVFLNDEEIIINSFKDYIQMHYDKEVIVVYDEYTPRWKVGVVVDTEGKYEHVSYVNGICTYQGGTHVANILGQICKKTVDYIKEKHKMNVKPDKIKDFLNIYVDSVIDDPDFNSQVKEKLTTKVAKFGSTYKIDNAFMNELYKTGYVEEIINYENYKQSKEANKSDGKKSGSLVGIEMLKDADKAGTSKSHECTLIITEGNSARKYAVDGMSVVGNQNFGVWPIRGKFINVGNATIKQLNENKEFVNFKKILGLVQGEIYNDETIKKLRYGHILILTDQDLDGSHIKGLIMSMFKNFWPELLQIDGFIQTLSTPIIKVFKKSDGRKTNAIQTFYTLQDYTKWETEVGGNVTKKYAIKYYKGLGTSSEAESKELFKEYDSRVISYIWKDNQEENQSESDDDKSEDETKSESELTSTSDDESSSESEEESDDENKPTVRKVKKNLAIRKVNPEVASSDAYDALSKAFDAERVPDRKRWLRKYDMHDIIEYKKRNITYKDFVDKDLIHFANYDNTRMIPSIDGLKTGQRKILYGTISKNIKDEIKVAQLAAHVAEKTAYKHGEKSLEETIVNLAQNYPGANNINILFPSGNFGTRTAKSGEDHAQSRYIFTYLESISKYIYRKEDDAILKHVEDEGEIVEPVLYAPVIPMILVNGTNGIGYGFSTKIPAYNPINVTNNLINLIEGKELEKMLPYYHGFTGEIRKLKDSEKKKKSKYISYKMTGKYEIIDEDTVLITEIPVVGGKASIVKYIKFLEKKIVVKDAVKKTDTNTKTKKKSNNQQILTSVKDDCGNNTIKIKVKFHGNILQKLNREGPEAIEKALGLSTTIKTGNFHLYDEFGRLTHYENVNEIMDDFYKFRLKCYKKRREFILKKLLNEMNIMKYKSKFIKEIVDETFIIAKRKKDDILKELKKKGYPVLHHDLEATDPKEDTLDDEKVEEKIENEEQNDSKHKKLNIKSYKYLTDMDLFSITYEKMKKINEEYELKKAEYEYYEKTTEKQLWLKEIKEFQEQYAKWIDERNKLAKHNDSIKMDKKGKIVKKEKKSTKSNE